MSHIQAVCVELTFSLFQEELFDLSQTSFPQQKKKKKKVCSPECIVVPCESAEIQGVHVKGVCVTDTEIP